jgi:osmotically-inducible protein OsmY
MMKKRAFQETPESLRMVDDLALEWGVRSALRRDARTADLSITVTAGDGRVCLLGVAEDEDERTAAEEVARAVEGARDVENQLKSASGSGSRYRREG